MPDIERPSNSGTLPDLSVPLSITGRRIFVPSRDTDWEKVAERQVEVDGILATGRTPERTVQELNQRFNGEWNDDQGLSFLHLLGAELPGLEIHGQAQGLVVSASQLDSPNLEEAELEASVWSMSVLNDVRSARGANINMSLWPLARVSGEFSDVEAVDANFNLARLDIRARRTLFAASFMIGTQGISVKNLREADFRQATILGRGQIQRAKLSPTDIMRNANSQRFLDASREFDDPFIDAVVHRDFDAANALEVTRNAEGQVWLNGQVSGSRMALFELTGSILDDVGFAGVNARLMRAAGLISRICNFSHMKAAESWLPGSVHIEPIFAEADISGANWPGSVLIDPALRGIKAVETNMDGSVVISDRPHHELEEQVKGRIKVVGIDKLASSVQQIVSEAQSGLGSARPRRELKS